MRSTGVQLVKRGGKTAAQPEKRTGRIALLGFGTVGRSVARILSTRPFLRLRLTHVCNRDFERKRVSWLGNGVQWTDNINHALAADVDIVVELIGGLKPAADWVRRALLAGKSVVTANKQLIAHHGPELIDLARKQGCHIGFGASVAGGIPVVSGLQEGLAGDRLFKVGGILNGTCNFILTKIEKDGVTFEAALREAQKLGFAEADPTEDVDGLDARAKLAILTRVGLRTRIRPGEIACRSISTIDGVDFSYARHLGSTIRQVSRAEVRGKRLFAAVEPAVVPQSSPLAGVQGSQNLVMATGEFGGETVFSGFGAGGDPTAVAVVSDLIAIAHHQNQAATASPAVAEAEHKVTADFVSPHYLRFTVKDRPGIIAAIAGIFSSHGINIDSVFQKTGYPKERLPFVITVEACRTSTMEQALAKIQALDFHVQPALRLPIVT